MASRLNPYLSFDGDARDAMEFYRSVFGGALTTNTFGDFGAQQSGDDAGKIMHSMLETDSGFTLMSADTPSGMERSANGTICISGDDADALRGYWEKLSSGGTVTMPMERQMWGDDFGMCVDKFGVAWMVDIAPPRE